MEVSDLSPVHPILQVPSDMKGYVRPPSYSRPDPKYCQMSTKRPLLPEYALASIMLRQNFRVGRLRAHADAERDERGEMQIFADTYKPSVEQPVQAG